MQYKLLIPIGHYKIGAVFTTEVDEWGDEELVKLEGAEIYPNVYPEWFEPILECSEIEELRTLLANFESHNYQNDILDKINELVRQVNAHTKALEEMRKK